MRRHFVATAFVVYEDAVLLHWHRKIQAWLPPGGHLEPNEDPVQAALRETLEETGIEVDILPTTSALPIDDPVQLAPPFTIQVEDIPDDGEGEHQHIDFIYFTVPKSEPFSVPSGWRWFTRKQLASREPVSSGEAFPAPPPDDVVKIGLSALDAAARTQACGPAVAGE